MRRIAAARPVGPSARVWLVAVLIVPAEAVPVALRVWLLSSVRGAAVGDADISSRGAGADRDALVDSWRMEPLTLKDREPPLMTVLPL